MFNLGHLCHNLVFAIRRMFICYGPRPRPATRDCPGARARKVLPLKVNESTTMGTALRLPPFGTVDCATATTSDMRAVSFCFCPAPTEAEKRLAWNGACSARNRRWRCRRALLDA